MELSRIRLFTNDTIAYLTIHTVLDHEGLQSDLEKPAESEKAWDMEFNSGKCEVLYVGRNQQLIVLDCVLHGQTLRTVAYSKYLGVTVPSNMSWNMHIILIKKANDTLAFLRRNLQVNSHSIKAQVYFGLVRPILEYVATVWDPYTKSNINKIEMVQRRVARFVIKGYRGTASVSEMLRRLG